MKRIIALSWVVALVLTQAGAAMAAPANGTTTINLRTCRDGGAGACQTAGDLAIDGVRVCLRQAGADEQCFTTEDGEVWVDSRPWGSYWASVDVPAYYQLAAATCTTFPNLSYTPCQPHQSRVHFVVHKDVEAVTINFLLTTP